MDLDRLYLDYNATSPLSTSVLNWLRSGDLLFANPSSQHNFGKASRKSINEARRKVFSTFHMNEEDHHLFFHSGATEALMTFTQSFVEWTRQKGKDLLVCYSEIDHPAMTTLSERHWGEHVSFHKLALKDDLTYNHEANLKFLRAKKEENKNLVILYNHLWVHNETGFVSSLIELNSFKLIPDLFIHVDGVQAPGKIPDWRELSEGDIWSFSAHKFGALKGIGFSFFKKGFDFFPLITGGGQQRDLRSGTENLQGVITTALALGDLEQVDVAKTQEQKAILESFLEEELKSIGGVLKSHQRNSNTIYFFFNHLTSDISLALFDLHGLMISAGSACSSGAARPSAVLLALKRNDIARNGLRLSLAFSVNSEDIDLIKTKMRPVFNKLRASLPKF